jgi:hypothetical protein
MAVILYERRRQRVEAEGNDWPALIDCRDASAMLLKRVNSCRQ